ncbi:uncharacterized protein PG998_008521 [Apiospora kogelbergensis]|uniref:uncharacterized protein n=1 Tax=Apiospora kogelbergensis TaxID=1337665 RepID=UPI00312D99F0
MNKHFYGEGRGLDRPAFHPLQTEDGTIQFQPTIAVLEDQCFLSVRYTVDRWEAPEYLPDILFCSHYGTNAYAPSRDFPQGLPELTAFRNAWHHGNEHSRYESQGHCSVCLTDYTFKMSLRPRVSRHPRMSSLAVLAEYRIEVVTYHQLGACRTPDDWMWKAFSTTQWGSLPDQVTRQQYIDSEHRPGAIKHRWDLGLARKEKRREDAIEASE